MISARSLKRKAPQQEWPSLKKPHAGDKDVLSVTNEVESHFTESDDEAETEKNVSTPLTSQCSGSPQYPSNAKTIPCTFNGCKKLFNRQAKLIQHLRSHTDTRPFICPHPPCTKAYLRDTHLQHHIKSAHSQIRDYICTWNDCGKAFATGTRFRRHLAAHEGNTKTCTIDGCGQVFRKHSTMEAHVKKVHQGLKPYTCQYLDGHGKMCGMGFDSSAQMRSHEGRMHSRNSFECTICLPEEGLDNRQTFPTYGALQEHIRTDHPPTCDLCDLACASKSSLKSHVEVKHGGMALEERRNFTCPEPGCERGFTKKGNMAAHYQSAHNNKRYICDSIDAADLNNVEGWDTSSACGEDFSTKANLQKHIRAAHMGHDNRSEGSRRKTRQRTKDEPTFEKRTGKAYGSIISCTILGCPLRFPTTDHLASHLQSRHGLGDHQVQTTMQAIQHTDTVFARPGFMGSTAFATREDLNAEAAFDDMLADLEFDSTTPTGDCEEPSAGGEDFWLGGASNERINSSDEWLYDEQEMQCLIHDDLRDAEDTSMKVDQGGMDIDPMLL